MPAKKPGASPGELEGVEASSRTGEGVVGIFNSEELSGRGGGIAGRNTAHSRLHFLVHTLGLTIGVGMEACGPPWSCRSS